MNASHGAIDWEGCIQDWHTEISRWKYWKQGSQGRSWGSWPLHSGKLVKVLIRTQCMMTSSNENIFRVTGSLCGEFTGHRWIPLTKAFDAERWCFLRSAPWIIDWVNSREAGELRSNHGYYDVIVMHLAHGTRLWNTTVPSNWSFWSEVQCCYNNSVAKLR